MTTTGDTAEFPIPTLVSGPGGIVVGPDGRLWFSETSGNKVGYITTSGAICEIAIPTETSLPQGIAVGPDGNIWITESDGNKIGRVNP